MSADADTIREALLVLSGHLPLFSGDKAKVERAEGHLRLRDDARLALARLEAAEAERDALAEAIEEYRLWFPGGAGHADAHRRLFAALAAVAPAEEPQ